MSNYGRPPPRIDGMVSLKVSSFLVHFFFRFESDPDAEKKLAMASKIYFMYLIEKNIFFLSKSPYGFCI